MADDTGAQSAQAASQSPTPSAPGTFSGKYYNTQKQIELSWNKLSRTDINKYQVLRYVGDVPDKSICITPADTTLQYFCYDNQLTDKKYSYKLFADTNTGKRILVGTTEVNI